MASSADSLRRGTPRRAAFPAPAPLLLLLLLLLAGARVRASATGALAPRDPTAERAATAAEAEEAEEETEEEAEESLGATIATRECRSATEEAADEAEEREFKAVTLGPKTGGGRGTERVEDSEPIGTAPEAVEGTEEGAEEAVEEEDMAERAEGAARARTGTEGSRIVASRGGLFSRSMPMPDMRLRGENGKEK